MSDNSPGPLKEVDPGTKSGATATNTTTTSHTTTRAEGFLQSISLPARQCHGDTVVGLRRRRAASQRLVPLADGVQDPWQPYRPERLSDVQIQAAVDAAEHLIAQNLPPLFDDATLKAMWKAGHRDLAEHLHAAAGGLVA
jgi:hypothetical protein